MTAIKKLPSGGLNEFGFFNYYNEKGELTTVVTSEHEGSGYMDNNRIVGMDCEMVGVGAKQTSALARVSIVNEYGYCLYNKFVKPETVVTDYRTEVSGIRRKDLLNAPPFRVVRQEVANILKNRILVGHALNNDLAALKMGHPKAKIRDTSTYFQTKFGWPNRPRLSTLARKFLKVEIQQGEHNSITDAQAAMALYAKFRDEWEQSIGGCGRKKGASSDS